MRLLVGAIRNYASSDLARFAVIFRNFWRSWGVFKKTRTTLGRQGYEESDIGIACSAAAMRFCASLS